MRILNLKLKNIGTFLDADIDFIGENGDKKTPPVTIITGENGTGKTLVLDAIRGLFLRSQARSAERNIVRDENDFLLSMDYITNSQTNNIFASKRINRYCFDTSDSELSNRFEGNIASFEKEKTTWNWVIDYWTSKLSTDTFNIQNLTAPKLEHLYKDALNGVHQNIEVTKLICFFDYLRTSENPKEKANGEKLFEIVKEIVKISLNNGELKYVSRTTLEPIISQAGQELTLDKLSSGNLYLIQRMVALLGKMYIAHIINNNAIENLCKTSGVLLIDEAENHLHPKWQKTFIGSIQKIFPNLQIILTTHSPFIVSSVENARIYVCQTNGNHAVITDETDLYANKPIEEILLSPLFGITYPFNSTISELLQRRKEAINTKNKVLEQEIQNKLKALNPQYFSFFEIDNLLTELMPQN